MNKVIKIKNEEDLEKLKDISKSITKGNLVVFPTETVYGIGADGLNEDAVRKIFKAKGRESDNPLILHISNVEMVEKLAQNITEVEYKLMDAFWPGPFTIVLSKKDIVPDVVTGGLDTVAIRMPANKIANKIIEYSGVPIAAPSANVSGKPSGTTVQDIYVELVDKVDYIVDGGISDIGIESTVVRVINGEVKILRPGKITKEDIQTIVENVSLDEHIFQKVEKGNKVLSPGMKYRHYAPKAKCILVYSENNKKMVEKVKDIAEEYTAPCIICAEENLKEYANKKTLCYGHKENLEEISKNIFTLLRQTDKANLDVVIIEGVRKEGIGLAIMNRLIRACSYNFFEIF